MPPFDEETFRLFSKNPLFKGLKEDELKLISSLSQERILQKGEYLVREKESPNELFVVIEGAFQVLKFDPQIQQTHVIDRIFPGEVIGEVSLLDHGLREASVQATENSRCRSLSFSDIQNVLLKDQSNLPIFLHLAERISKKLRRTNELAVEALRKTMEEFQIRSKMGELLMVLISCLSILIFSLPILRWMLRNVANSTYITLPMTFVFGLLLVGILKSFALPWRDLGITTKNLKRAAAEGFFFTLPWLGGFALIKWAAVAYIPIYIGRPFFEPYSMFTDPQHKTIEHWIAINGVYCLVIVPIQELLVRGGMQQLLLKFLNNKHRVALSILISNLIFSSSHVFFSVQMGIAVFFMGLFLGWLYSRTRNLASPIIAHILIGMSTISCLGLVSALLETPF